MSPDRSEEENILPLARELNERLAKAAPEVFEMLSALGRRLYFPKGILTQGAEAKQKAHRLNATIGIATENGAPMHLPSIARAPRRHLARRGVQLRAARGPAEAARALARQDARGEPGAARASAFGLPIVTSAITHGLMLAGDLFVDPGDVDRAARQALGQLPAHLRGAARRADRRPTRSSRATASTPRASRAAIEEAAGARDKVIALLNFPNNPTGYMPTEAEGRGDRATRSSRRPSAARRVVALLDDAYFGLFYHLGGESMTRVAVRPTSRTGTRTCSRSGSTARPRSCSSGACAAASSRSAPAAPRAPPEVLRRARGQGEGRHPQRGLERARSSPRRSSRRRSRRPRSTRERAEKDEIAARARGEGLRGGARAALPRELATSIPSTAATSCAWRSKGVEAERSALHLLDKYGIGTIATGGHDLRIAFSCLEVGRGGDAVRDAPPRGSGTAFHLTFRAQAGSVARRLPERCRSMLLRPSTARVAASPARPVGSH